MSNELTLRPYQQLAIDAMLEKKKGIVELPTGAGKTIVAIGFLKQLASKRYDVRSLVLVPTRALQAQWEEVATEYLPVTQRPIIMTYGKFIRNYQSLPIFQRGLSKNEVRVLIIDEAHHMHDNTKLLRAINDSGAINFDYVIGFTATLYTNMTYGGLEIIFRKPASDLIKLGYISSFEPIMKIVNLAEYNTEVVLTTKRRLATLSKQMEQTTDEKKKRLLEIQRDTLINTLHYAIAGDENIIYETVESALEINPPKIIGKAVVFEGYVLILTLRRAAAIQIETLLKERIKEMTGVDAEGAVLYYDYDTPQQEKIVKQRLRERKWHFLIAVKRLSEGVDIPELNGEVLSSYSTSQTVTVRQMIGRLTRMTKTKARNPPKLVVLIPAVDRDKYERFWDKVLQNYL